MPQRTATIERLKQAREINGWTQSDLAERAELPLLTIQYAEAGRGPIATDALGRIAMVTGFPLAFFFQPPPPQFPLGSLLFHQSYVCDPCERETGDEVEAQYHCVACGEDLCILHEHRYDGPLTSALAKRLKTKMATLRRAARLYAHPQVTLCPTCYEQAKQA